MYLCFDDIYTHIALVLLFWLQYSKQTVRYRQETGNYIMRNLTIICFTVHNIQAYYIKDDEMGVTCNTYVEDEKYL